MVSGWRDRGTYEGINWRLEKMLKEKQKTRVIFSKIISKISEDHLWHRIQKHRKMVSSVDSLRDMCRNLIHYADVCKNITE